MARVCSARRKNGQPCKHAPILGGTVCYNHGGAAPQVKAAAKRRLLDIIDPDRVFREMARIGFADPSEAFDADGNLRPLKEWPASLKRTLAGIEVVKRNLTSGDGEIDQVLKVKFWDKPKALEQMGRVLAMFKDKQELNITGSVDLVSRLAAGRKRVADARKP